MACEAVEMSPADILVVDDVPANLELLRDILSERGYRIRPALGGNLALRSAATRRPDLILLDVTMPDMDGYEVCRILKADEKYRDIPVIFISGLNDIRDKVKAFEAGGVDYITKPFKMEEVLARVETHLALRRLQEQLKQQNTQLQREIAERREAEEALRRSENTYRTIFENTGTALVIVEEDTTLSLVNTRFGALSGYAREEVEGKLSWKGFVAQEDLEWMMRNQVTRRIELQEAPANFEFQFVDRQGRAREVVANVSMIPETQKTVASLIDVSELRKMEAELQTAHKWESIGIFSGGIAHDFNNLLGIVLGNITLARMNMAHPEPEVLKYLHEAEQICLQSKDLTQRLIALTADASPVRSTYSLRGLITDAASSALLGSSVQCELDLAEDLWPVDCDLPQIREMVLNLVSNAEEAMEQGGVIRISARNDLLTSGSRPTLRAGPYVHLAIKDHGKGIHPALLPKVFDPYYSTKVRGTKKGMGLGLPMAYAVVKSHDGEISLETEVGAGTTVHVYLPASVEST